MSAVRRVRIGIDVGGTFTHAVALDADSLAIAGKVKVPTTHAAEAGVARGVVDALLRLLDAARIDPGHVLLIAHSTTQATNALLEGDVSPVGVLGMGAGASAALARMQTAIPDIPLAPQRRLRTFHRFLRSERAGDAAIDGAISSLIEDGAEVIVVAEAFAVDDPSREQRVCERAAACGVPATASHHVSRLHGLRIRTRTAVINASMMKIMLRTANETERAVREAGITAPLMVMRSDGGVMSLDEMRRRPILTMLSGPAAGVAAALLHARLSDGIFLEVGGTSTDISVIKNGRCQVRSAVVGGNQLHVSTLDVRTIGVAGGSLVYLRGREPAQVGPRSAHIAGLPYLSFTDATPDSMRAVAFEFEGDSFLSLEADGSHVAVTPTCAANQRGLVPAGDPARGRDDRIAAGLEHAATVIGSTRDGLAERILGLAADSVRGVVDGLIRDYRLERGLVRLVGGGGGAAAIVPFVAQSMALPHEIVAQSDVISAIGVALALVRDTIERTVIAPTDDDLRRIRQEAFDSVCRMGAAPETIEVFVEVDAKHNLIRATGEGSTDIRRADTPAGGLNESQRAERVRASVGAYCDVPRIAVVAGGFEVWVAAFSERRWWRIGARRREAVRVLDSAGVIRWQSNCAEARASTVATAERDLDALAERHTRYSDAGATIPRCFVLLAGRIINLSGLIEMRQVLEVLRMDLSRATRSEACVLLAEFGS